MLSYRLLLKAVTFVLFVPAITAHSQSATINGPACATAGMTCTYYVTGNYSQPDWTVNANGTINQKSGNNAIVTWNTSGMGSITFLSLSGSTSLSVSITNLNGGSVTANKTQTINYNGIPGTINCLAATGGNCNPNYSYQWQSSTDNVNWGIESGKTTQNISFSANYFKTTYFRRMVTENTTHTVAYSDVATVYVNPPFSMVTLNPPSQDIFTENTPVMITPATTTTGGNCGGVYSYQWGTLYYGVMGTFTPLTGSGTTGLNYSPVQTTVTSKDAIYYQRRTTCGSETAYSTVSILTRYLHLATGTIAASASLISYNSKNWYISGGGGIAGMCENYSYQWQNCTDNINFADIPGETSSSPTPVRLTATTYYRLRISCGSETKYTNTAIIAVNPQLFTGRVTPRSVSIPSGTSPGQLNATPAAGGGGCSGTYDYQWQKSTDGNTFNDITGAKGLTYTPGNLTANAWYRLLVTCSIDAIATNACYVAIGSGTPVTNFVQARTITKGGVTNETTAAQLTATTDVREMTQYFDGFGRLLQSVARQETPAGKDLVVPNEYDELGQEVIKYLPYVSSASDGLFKANALVEQNTFNTGQFPGEQLYFSKTDIEASPLSRVSSVSAPGSNWVGANRKVGTQYFANTVTDYVQIWKVTNSTTLGTFSTYSNGGFYGDGQLYKTITTDEGGKQVIEFKDKTANVILKKVQLSAAPDDGSGSSHSDWLCTYYIYDDLKQLRCVIQPRGVEQISPNWMLTNATILFEQCFRYEYDRRGRMSMKKVPGAGEVYMVYDKRDRLVFTQDANMRPQNNWLYTLYDDVDRPVQTGIMTYAGFANLQTYADGTTVATLPASVSGSNVDATAGSLVLPEREIGIGNYDASIDITFTDGFVSENNAEFTAQIVTAATSTFTSPQSVNLNPVPAGTTLTALTYTFYDNYNWTTTNSYNTAGNSNVSAGTNLYAEPLPAATNTQVRTQVTGTRVRVIEDAANLAAGKWLENVSFYDDKQRPVQVQMLNVTGGRDITTSLYDFTGKVLSTYTSHQKLGGTAKSYAIASRNTYDAGGRITKTEKNLNNGGWKTAAAMDYNELGQLKNQKLGTDPVNTANPLEALAYDYNIRGWLLGVNRDYAKTPNSTANYFGFDLGYDKTGIKPASGSSIGSFNAAAYNGNISGMVWKSTGDDKVRKYDFTYDNVNRLTGAAFKQYSTTNSVFDLSDNVDFSVSNLTYDANGNILTQYQKGLVVNSSSLIDQLTYTYVPNSNRLQNVIDGVNSPTTMLGDFRSSQSYMSVLGTKTVANAANYTDYSYDVNGNLTADKNKDITGIIYNYLNLPQSIAVSGKGTIQYVYDAAGNKLKKIVKETGKADKTTLYLFGVYQDEILQFLPQEEGRIRKKEDGSFAYDYFLKDHLGNVRTVLTEEQKTDAYPPLSFEGAAGSAEVNDQNAIWEKADGTAFDVTGKRTTQVNMQGYAGTPSPLTYCLQVRGSTGKIGAAKLIKVMGGDKITTTVQYYYSENTGSGSATGLNTLVAGLASVLTNSMAAPAGLKAGASAVSNAVSTDANAVNFFATQNASSTTGRPKAFLNVLFFDEQFKFDASTSYFQQIKTTSANNPGQEVVVNRSALKNGYCYIYISNETNDLVYFDNLTLSHTRGQVLEETHYYPFGLTMSGISSKAAGSLSNKLKYNGNEEQRLEFSDDSGLELYDFNARTYDQQIGRFHQIDPLSSEGGQESWTPYHFSFNNPILRHDPTGKFAPIYNEAGNLLGTDDQGLQGKAIVMDEKNFQQGMKHDDALKSSLGVEGLKDDAAKTNLLSSFNSLPNRPDYDGQLTLSEANEWYRNGNGAPLFVDLNKIDLSGIHTEDFTGVGSREAFNLLYKSDSYNDAKVYGSITFKLYPNNNVKAYQDRYDFEMHNPLNPLNWPRNIATGIGRAFAGTGNSYPINFYGSVYITPVHNVIK